MPYKDPADKKKWRSENREKNNANNRRWRIENPERQAQIAMRGEAKKLERDAIPTLVMKLFNDKIDSIIAQRCTEENKDLRYRRLLRERAIDFLGGKCEWCGFEERLCLQIDHKTPVRRRTNGISNHNSSAFCRDILSGEEKNAQLLCANCHVLKTRMDREYGNSTVAEQFDPYAGLGI